MLTKMLLFLGIMTLLGGTVHAQGMLFGPQAGYYKVQDADHGSYMGGMACRIKFIPVMGAQVSINYRRETYAGDAVTVRSWPVMVTGLVYPLPFLYGAVGADWYNLTFDYDQDRVPLVRDETIQKVGWHFGGGVEIPAGPAFTLTGDVRYVFLDYGFKEIPGSNSLKSNFYIITIGLLFSL